MRAIPDALKVQPFTPAQALKLGVPKYVLKGSRFTRVHPGVWRWHELELSHGHQIRAAQLALPADARMTGITRIQATGLDFGPRLPVRFVVPRDHHIALDGIFLHRTKRLPPTDVVGVSPYGAFVAYCALARVIDAIKVGDWLLTQCHMTLEELGAFVIDQPWRSGAHEAAWLLPHLSLGSRSLKESETSALLRFSGLPAPDLNAPVELLSGLVIHGDLVYRQFGLIIEYEGVHHQTDRTQYLLDLDRYSQFRRSGLEYCQVTTEMLRRPQRLVRHIHSLLVAGGYQGRPPVFCELWPLLWHSVSRAAGPKPQPARAVA
ncbi:MAG: hypothetical protein WB767_06395 [Nocardioides sp.]